MDNLNEHIVSNNNWIHLVGASDEVLLEHAEKYQLPNDNLSDVNDRFEIAHSEESD